MLKRVTFPVSIALAVVGLSHGSLAGVGASAQPQVESRQAQTPNPSSPEQPSQASRSEMMKMHQRMMEERKAADVKLDELIRDMNAATGEAKISAMELVVNELVRQRKTPGDHMRMMDQQTMMGGRGMIGK